MLVSGSEDGTVRSWHVASRQCVQQTAVAEKGGELRVPRHVEGLCVCVFVCVFFPFILDIKFVGRTSRGHTGGRSHRISHPPSFCGACLNFSREKDRRP